MAYTYQADVWCDDCARKIMADIAAETKCPTCGAPAIVVDGALECSNEECDWTEYGDEGLYDFRDWPKYYNAENEESDGPENCASGTCGGQYLSTVPGDAKYLSRGRYGTFLENCLTAVGYRALKSMLDGHGELLPSHAQEWADYYQFTWHHNPWGHPLEWLDDKLRELSPTAQDTSVANFTSTGLWEYASAMASMLDGDQIQDLFQADMDDDGYFRETGWYSGEMTEDS